MFGRMWRGRVGTLVVGGVLLGGGLTVAPSAAHASSVRVSGWSLPSDRSYVVGVDTVGGGGGGYEKAYRVISPGGTDKQWELEHMPSDWTLSAGYSFGETRLEVYAMALTGSAIYDSYVDGAAAVTLNGAGPHNVGAIPVPRLGEPGTGVLSGSVVSRSATPSDRVSIDIFQTSNERTTSTGYRTDAFSSGKSRNGSYATGPLWPGQYIAFVTDNTTGNKATALVEVNGNTTIDLDLDTKCFGLDDCQWAGSVTMGAGGFHPVGPNRILDTRNNIGIAGAVTPGDGRNSDPNPVKRLASKVNHEFQVTGMGGVPTSGVTSVLLNITATGASQGGIAQFFPKPTKVDNVFDDQNSYGSHDPGSVIVWKAGEDVANLMIVPVGVGGKIRVDSYAGSNVHLLADVVGWFDAGQPGQSGSRVSAITPTRLLDTRLGVGGPATAFASGESRSLQVTSTAGIPADASAVIGTLTGVNPAGSSYVTTWPAGTPQQETSVLNVQPNAIRPNLVSVGVGNQGHWSIYNYSGPHDLLFDAVGYFHPSQGYLVTPVNATKVLDTPAGLGSARQPIGEGETREVSIAGVAGIPGDVKAVFLNVSVSRTDAWSYLTVWGSGDRPVASNLNWTGGEAPTNLVLAPVGSDGKVRIYNAFGRADLVAQVVGYLK